jgi:hypothetical protein
LIFIPIGGSECRDNWNVWWHQNGRHSSGSFRWVGYIQRCWLCMGICQSKLAKMKASWWGDSFVASNTFWQINLWSINSQKWRHDNEGVYVWLERCYCFFHVDIAMFMLCLMVEDLLNRGFVFIHSALGYTRLFVNDRWYRFWLKITVG